ncbi:MAG: hypothetical protein J6O55_07320 [Lachnospiraceae bacterium]|nr:hypothetical protein [Lachnospiraceae bacterium]
MKKKIIATVCAASLLSLALMGCQGTGSSGWGGAGNSDAAPSEAAASEEASASADSAGSDTEMEEVVEENHDILAGTVEDGSYFCEATLGSEGQVYISVSATESSLVDQKAAGATAIKEKSGTDLSAARLKWLTAYYEGDEASAKEDMADFEGIDKPSSTQLSEIMKYSEDLGKLFTQFGITDYDLNAPDDASEDNLEYDVYSSTGNKFLLSVYYNEGIITDFSFDIEEM